MSRASSARDSGPLISDRAERAAVEARNALLQFDEVRRLIGSRLGNLALTPQDICGLQSIAVRDIFACAGKFRKIPVEISGTPHEPPPHEDVPRHVDEMCAYANSIAAEPFHVSAYLMWRINWIYAFADGNGRTSRAVSYLALCCGLGMELPGTVTVPELIVRNKIPYYAALEAADAAWANNVLDVSLMQKLIALLLAEQLKTAI